MSATRDEGRSERASYERGGWNDDSPRVLAKDELSLRMAVIDPEDTRPLRPGVALCASGRGLVCQDQRE